MMYESLKAFEKQFEFNPVIINGEKLTYPFAWYIVAGMGGSNLTPDLIKIWKPDIQLAIHRNYGLPNFSLGALQKSLCIASSYSGNTEETLDAFQKAGTLGIPRIAISTGGKLLELAKQENTPYIELPNTGIEPRMALGFSMLGVLKALGEDKGVAALQGLSRVFKSATYEESGKTFAELLKNKIPVNYASEANKGIAYAWKIAFSETAKIPAFYNFFPELNHNEMTGFDKLASTEVLSKNFHFIFLKDSEDHERIQKRMEVTESVFRERGFAVSTLALSGTDAFHKVFGSIIIAYWSAYLLAKSYGVDPEGVPFVEFFKKQIG